MPANETKRVPVTMSVDQHEELKEAADRVGVPISTYLRMEGLKAARAEAAHV